VSPAKRRSARRQPAARERAIGIFDSGIGGLTVVRALTKLLPNESLVYLGDTGRYPYGTKSADVVRRYSLENTAFLVDKEIKLLVVACNTSTALALDAVEARVDVPVVGVIEPGARAAARASRNRKIGVIGTRGRSAAASTPAPCAACARTSRSMLAPARCSCRWPRRDGSTTRWRSAPHAST
jgi:glutamate racemase